VALRVGDRELTYAELASAARASAARIQAEAGAERGARVAVWTHPSLETAVTIAGNALAGIVTVPLNPQIGEAERAHVLADAAPCAIVDAQAGEIRPHASGARESAEPHRASEVDPVLVVYTSGTTGAPKGAVLTARNIASNLDALASRWRWSEADTIVHALPLFHVHGLVLGLFGALRAGSTLDWVERFSPDGIAAALGRGGPTVLFAVPTMYHRLADAADRDARVARALGAARLLVSGSAPMPLREHERIARLTGRSVIERYGLTETLIDCAMPAHEARPGLVGPALDGIEVRLVDDARTPIEPGGDSVVGEIAVRGANVFAGYLNRPDDTARARDAEGWFYTGDLGTIAPDGWVRILGRRATDLIKTGGFKVGAGEVESALLEHPDVAEAAVIGAPDDDLGERIVAFVVPRDPDRLPDPRALADHVARWLAPHKRPRDVELVRELPRNAMGKIQKHRLVKR